MGFFGLLSLLALGGFIFFHHGGKKTKQPEACSSSCTATASKFEPPVRSRIGPWPAVPGARPFFGNELQGGIQNCTVALEDWASKYGHETGVFEFTTMGRTILAVCCEDLLAQLDTYRPHEVVRRQNFSRALNSVGATGVFTAEGDVWKKERRLVGPALNRKNVREYVSIAKLVTNRLIRKWEGIMKDDGVVVINDDTLLYSIDIISLVAFANDINSLQTGDAGVCEDIDSLLKRGMFRIFSPFPFWNIPIIGNYLDGSEYYRRRVHKKIRTIIAEHERATDDTTTTDKNDEENERRRTSFLGRILALSKTENALHLTEDRVIGNIFTMFSAGSETTYNTNTVCLYELALDKVRGGSLQDEIAQEISVLFGHDQDDSTIDFTTLNEGLPTLRSLVYEVLRMKGPSPILNGQPTIDLELTKGVTIPAHSNLILLIRAASMKNHKGVPRGPNDAPPDVFCPRRWLKRPEENNDTTTTTTTRLGVIKPTYKDGFRSFGSSARVCPGRDLSEMEILVLFAYLLRTFEIRLEGGESHEPMKYVTQISYRPTTDVRLVLHKRQQMATPPEQL